MLYYAVLCSFKLHVQRNKSCSIYCIIHMHHIVSRTMRQVHYARCTIRQVHYVCLVLQETVLPATGKRAVNGLKAAEYEAVHKA